MILGYTSPEEAPLLTRWHLTQTVADIDHGRALAARGRRVHVHLALDTGMHRLGILAENRKEILEAFRLPNLVVDGVFSHLYVSDSLEAEDVAYTQEQLTLFYDTVAWPELPDMIPAKFISSPAMDFGTSQLSPVTMSGLESHSMEFEAMMRLFSEALTCGRFCLSGPEWPVSALCKPERAPGTGGSFRQSKKPNWRWSPSATRTVCPGICLSGAARC